jgi:hypothetical protein
MSQYETLTNWCLQMNNQAQNQYHQQTSFDLNLLRLWFERSFKRIGFVPGYSFVNTNTREESFQMFPLNGLINNISWQQLMPKPSTSSNIHLVARGATKRWQLPYYYCRDQKNLPTRTCSGTLQRWTSTGCRIYCMAK